MENNSDRKSSIFALVARLLNTSYSHIKNASPRFLLMWLFAVLMVLCLLWLTACAPMSRTVMIKLDQANGADIVVRDTIGIVTRK